MPQRERAQFRPTVPVAFHADLFGALFGMLDDEPDEPFELVGTTAVVSISGPLDHHADGWWDSYDAIGERCAAALASEATTLLLKIDSPGGVVSGDFELAESLKAKAAAAGKRLVAYADGYMCSAAYAIACAASEIYAPKTATVGSIGVMQAYVDGTAQDAAYGERWHLFTSGSRKADGNPHQAVSGDAAKRAQEQVDELAEMFFAHVSASRPIAVDALREMNGGIFFGAGAKAAGLIDDVKTLEDVLASPPPLAATTNEEEVAVDWKDALKKAADEGDEMAKHILDLLAKGKLDEEGEGDGDGGDEPGAESEGEEPEGEEEEKKPDAKRAKTPGALAKRVALLEENEEKRRLVATRPDLPAATRAKMLGQPLSAVRFAVANFPKGTAAAKPTPAAAPAAATLPAAHAAAATPGATQGAGPDPRNPPALDSEDARLERQIDVAMGVAKPKVQGVVNKSNVTQFGMLPAAKAAERLRELEKEGAQ